MLRSIKTQQRLPRLIAAKIDGTGTASVLIGATEVSLTDNGVGDYTITIAKPPVRLINVQLTSLTADRALQVGTIAAGNASVQVLAKDLGAVAADADFFICLVCSDAADEI